MSRTDNGADCQAGFDLIAHRMVPITHPVLHQPLWFCIHYAMKSIRYALAPAILAAVAATALTAEPPREQPGHGLVAVVGGWRNVNDGGPAFRVDTAGWSGVTEAAPLQAMASRLFGAVNDTFVTNGTAPQAFPLAVHGDTKHFSSGTIRVQFKLVGGASDNNAGIAFNLKPNGEYLYLRYNTKDGNLALWQYKNGERARIAMGEPHVQLPLNTWHDLEVSVTGRKLTASVSNKALTFAAELPEPIAGRVGLWTKRDAITVFRNYHVTR